MAKTDSPVAIQRRLVAELREARTAFGGTQKEVADALDWSASKLIRIENCSVGLSITDLKALLLHYGITDGSQVKTYVEMARASKRPSWWDEHRDICSPAFMRYIGLEAAALRLRQFQSLLVPGLLQIPAYTHSLMTAYGKNEVDANRAVEVRSMRQKRLQDLELEHFFILDEAMLYRRAVSNEAWRAQLHHLKKMTGQSNVTLQILPFNAGFVSGMENSFVLLQLSEQVNDYFLSLEYPDGDVFFDDAIGLEKAAEYLKVFYRLENAALPPEETPRMINKALRRLEEE